MANPLPSQLQTIEALRAREEAERADKERGERRNLGRAIGRWEAQVVTSEGAARCIVTDLSLTGARLQLVSQFYRLQELRFELDGKAPLNTEVMWRTRSNVGIRFTDDPAHVAEIISPLLASATSKL